MSAAPQPRRNGVGAPPTPPRRGAAAIPAPAGPGRDGADVGASPARRTPHGPHQVAELLQRLQGCGHEDFEALCGALAEKVQHVSPSDVPRLFHALISALQARIAQGHDQPQTEVLDELCGSWESIRLVPRDALRTFLRLLLQSQRSSHRERMRGSRSSPDLSKRPPPSAQQRARSETLWGVVSTLSDAFAEEEASAPAGDDRRRLPPGDARLLQVLLRLLGHGEDAGGGGSPSDGGVPLPQRQPSRGRRQRSSGSSCSVEKFRGGVKVRRGTGSLLSPVATSGTAAHSLTELSEESRWASQVMSPDRGPRDGDALRLRVFDMAEDDSSVSRCSQGAASLDWCFDALDGASRRCSRAPSHHERSLALTPRASRSQGRRSRGHSLPAELRAFPVDRAVEDHMRSFNSDVSHHDLQQLGECMQAQTVLSQDFAQLRQNQVVCLQTAQEVAGLVVEMNRAVEAERAARLAEIQERTALRAELQTVCAQVEQLARGQQELQRCMMMMCASMAQQPQPAQQHQQQARGSRAPLAPELPSPSGVGAGRLQALEAGGGLTPEASGKLQAMEAAPEEERGSAPSKLQAAEAGAAGPESGRTATLPTPIGRRTVSVHSREAPEARQAIRPRRGAGARPQPLEPLRGLRGPGSSAASSSSSSSSRPAARSPRPRPATAAARAPKGATAQVAPARPQEPQSFF